MMDLFGQAGALRHLPEIRIEHMHPVAGKADTDDQYQRVNHRDQFRKDRQAYEGWQRTELPTQMAAVRALRPGQRDEPPVRLARTTTGRPAARRGGTVSTRYPRFFKRVQAATPEDVMVALADFASAVPGDQEIVELGVFQGRSALMMAWGARQGQGAHVTAIDLWDSEGNVYDPPFTDPGTRRWAFHWVQSLGYSRDITLVQGFSHELAETYEGKPVGLLYVDGDHTREGARRDIMVWARHLAPGARIAVDDYGHPDWPGVGEAVDELVAEGFLEPFELFHDRLAVTRLADQGEKLKRTGTTAITGEGVHPSPYPAVDGQAALGPASVPEKAQAQPEPDRATLEAEWERVDPEGVAALRESAAALAGDTGVSSGEAPGLRVLVHAGELEDVAEGTPITELNTVQLRALAKKREIVLGTRKDKRGEMLAALEKGA
jgi:Methyltransferase domain